MRLGTRILVGVSLFLLGMAGGLPAGAQTTSTAASYQTFSLTGQAIALPGNHQTVAASVSGLTFTPTPNFDLREDNVLVPGTNLMGFFGGFNYRLPAISTALNNVSPTLNGYSFQFYLTGSAGVDRISPPAGSSLPVAQHYAFLAGIGFNYKLSKGGAWTFGGEARYAKLPGYANNTAIIGVGPTLHF